MRRYNARMLRVLIIGAGDIARRILPLLATRCQVYAVLRDAGKADWWRRHGAIPILADLDRPSSIKRLSGLLRSASWVIHLAPPADSAEAVAIDRRSRRLRAANAGRKGNCRWESLPQRWVYISTTGVYGDLNGAWADETASCQPRTTRGRRRLDAEGQLRKPPVLASVLRVPGIYAGDRLPTARIAAGMPVLNQADDVFTNHIHADDLARIVVAALRHGRPSRVYHAVDDAPLRMGDWFDAVANASALPKPPRVDRSAAARLISPAMMSYFSESRRLRNDRLKRELRVRLRYPTFREGLAALRSPT